MNIHIILSARKHNSHYLNRYISFIQRCQAYNTTNPSQYMEQHHICPKAKDMFPEYKNLALHPWNRSILTYRQHIIAHILLYKVFGTQSQILSILRTSGQVHVKNFQLKSVNSRFIENAKIQLSNFRRGVFVRGYNLDGTPNVSEDTRRKLSQQKKELYSNPENRKKHSIACIGSKRINTLNMSIYSQNRPLKHNHNISKGIKEYYNNLRQSGASLKKTYCGIYITPFGNFTGLQGIYRNYCRNSSKPFTIHSVKKNPYVNKMVIGCTPKDLGFDFIPKNHPERTQYCASLNQVRLPEPSHPLWSELNDYLSHGKHHL